MIKTDYTRRDFLKTMITAGAGMSAAVYAPQALGQEITEPTVLKEIDDNLYQATLEQLTAEDSPVRSADHALIMFSVDEEAAGWECPPCEHMLHYFSWRASDSESEGIGPTQLMYVVVKVNPASYSSPDFLSREIEGWPTIIHLTKDSDTEILEDRIQGLAIGPFRDLVRDIEASYQ